MTVPPPPLPSRPSAGPGLDSFPQEMDEILTSWSIDNTAGEVALAPGHEGRRRRLLPGQRGLAEPFGVRLAVRGERAEAAGRLSRAARPNAAGPDNLRGRPGQHIDALLHRSTCPVAIGLVTARSQARL